MPWARFDDGLLWHPKARRMSTGAFGMLLKGVVYSAKYLTDGHLGPEFLADHARGKADRRLLDELVQRGFLIPAGDGYLLNDFLDYNFSKLEVEAKRARDRKKQAAKRARDAGLDPPPSPEESPRESPGESPDFPPAQALPGPSSPGPPSSEGRGGSDAMPDPQPPPAQDQESEEARTARANHELEEIR